MERGKIRLGTALSSSQRSSSPLQFASHLNTAKEITLLQRRRRCKSEGLETSPFGRKFIDKCHEICNHTSFSESHNVCDRVSNSRKNDTKVSNGKKERIWSQSDFNNYQYNNYTCYSSITEKMVFAPEDDFSSQPVNGRKKSVSPVQKPSPKSKCTKEGYNYYNMRNWYDYDSHESSASRRSRSPNRLIENEKPKLPKCYESVPFPEQCLTDYGSHKTPLKSIVNNKRRSASPPIKKMQSPVMEKTSKPVVSKLASHSSEGRRRQRAISESEYNYCLSGQGKELTDSCTQTSGDSVMLKRAREDFSCHVFNIVENAPRVVCPPINCSKDQAVEENVKGMEVQPPCRMFDVPSSKSLSVVIKPLRSRTRLQPPSSITITNGSTDSTKSTDDSSEEPSGQMHTVLQDYVAEGGPIADMIVDIPKSSCGDMWYQCTRPSLFPNVGAYLRFYWHDLPQPVHPPPALARHLKWRLTTITPVVVRRTLVNSGFKLVKSESDILAPETDYNWVGIWGKHMKSICFKTLREGQKMNHFPGSFHIGRKDRLWRNLQKMVAKFGKSEFGMMPLTYVLPHDLKMLKRDWEKHAASGEKWIIKPPASARGTGIKVVSRWTQIPKRRPIVVQLYISRPLLIHDSKFDIRLYVLVTSMHPLRIYLYPDGLARFASVKYSEEISSLQDRYMHLTNYSINRLSKTYQQNEEANACQGHKWTLRSLLSYLEKERNVNIVSLWEKFKDVVIKTIICGEANITAQTRNNVPSRYNCYELFGIDILLDEELKPWLLEVNISPSLHSASPLDLHVKGPLVSTLLNMAQYHVPAKVKLDTVPRSLEPILYDKRLYTIFLSKEEKDKHEQFTGFEYRSEYLDAILSDLTSDDIRHLIQAEDELVAAAAICASRASGSSDTAGTMQRIFPTQQTHIYHRYIAVPRYYNRLFDAWEHKYASRRSLGIKLLQCLCNMGKHLEVPSTPIVNDSDADAGSSSAVAAPVADAAGGAKIAVAGEAEASPAPPRRRRLCSPLRPVPCRECESRSASPAAAAPLPRA